ncbi:MAG: glutamate--tRNA ligase family protein [Patescibacteria group bacterium]
MRYLLQGDAEWYLPRILMVRVRIAPSPTGIPHIGNTRTALFNFLFARRNNGEFLLRIEDTDRARFVPESEKAIYEILEWLGLKWDGKVIKQSQRLEIYKDHAEQLLKKGSAYKKEGAIHFEMPRTGETSWDDLIGNKHISFKNETQEDFVIIKSDGFPTYNFANVVDDHLMEISHVIRGEEFISSTPKHIQLYKAFGWSPPDFAHLQIVLGPDRAQLSTMHGAKSILDFRKEGFLKEALLNYMALLGWRFAGQMENEERTPYVFPEREIMSLDFMILFFELKDVNTTSPIFDIKKLEWMNGMYIRKSQISNLKSQIWEYLDKKYPVETIGKTAPLIKDRIKKLSEYLLLCDFFFKEPEKYEIDLSGKKEMFRNIEIALENLTEWDEIGIGEHMQKVAKDIGVKNREFFMLLRVAVTGKKISPPLNESMEILGKEKVIKRIKKVQNL